VRVERGIRHRENFSKGRRMIASNWKRTRGGAHQKQREGKGPFKEQGRWEKEAKVRQGKSRGHLKERFLGLGLGKRRGSRGEGNMLLLKGIQRNAE